MDAVIDQNRDEARFLAKVYGYVALGLLMTAIVAFAVGALFAKALVGDNPEGALNQYFVLMVVSGIALLIDTIVMRVILLKNNRSGWIPYIIYCALFGIFLSSFVIMGVPFQTFGEAFAISALVFFILFILGYFSKLNLNIVSSIALTILFGAILIGLVAVVVSLFNNSVISSVNLLTDGGVLIVMTILIAADAYNVKRLASSGSDNQNTLLYCASTLYTDFIYIFIRILIFLLRVASKVKNN